VKVALVTGGSRGIGRAIVWAFARANTQVAFTYVQRADAAEELCAAVAEAGGRAVAYRADVRDFVRAEEVVRAVQEALGPIDVLVNNSGIRRDGLLANMDPAAWTEVLDTNLTGTFNYTRAAMRSMIRRGGVVISVSSVSGVSGLAGQVNYSASKAGIIGFTKALAKEVARFGVRVNAVAPGFIETDMTASLDEAARKKRFSLIPLGKPGTAEQVASLVAYLAGDDAAYISGQVFLIDGGLA
jgi:3-oxoacyl-[acyl-carrier protein] reductase